MTTERYPETAAVNQVQKVLEDANDEYNLSHTAQMNLVFFQEPAVKMGGLREG